MQKSAHEPRMRYRMKRFARLVRFTAAMIYSLPDLKARFTTNCAKTIVMISMITEAAEA